jgi:F0F1-type ATP synthase membrane subunit c/vacuolar-type H+-ATPase subunit K
MDLWALLIIAALGAYHGLNPAMGWLFAVALGMQDRDRGAVIRALPAIAIGHELALVLVVALVLGLGLVADTSVLHMGAAVALIAFGIFRFVKPRAHPRWTTMRVNRRELAWWSFLMSSAHGAGLMIAPVLIGAGAADAAAHDHGLEAVKQGTALLTSTLGLVLHVAAMVAVMGVIAVVVYEKVGVAVLRKAWVNLDGVWAGAFVLAGLLTLFT